MGVTSDILGAHGGCHELRHENKTYRVRLINQAVKAEWEKRLMERDIAPIMALKAYRDEATISGKLDAVEQAFREGKYELLSPAGALSLKSTSGVRLLLSLLIGCDENELMGLVLAKKEEVIRLIETVIRESFPGMDFARKESEDTDPNE